MYVLAFSFVGSFSLYSTDWCVMLCVEGGGRGGRTFVTGENRYRKMCTV